MIHHISTLSHPPLVESVWAVEGSRSCVCVEFQMEDGPLGGLDRTLVAPAVRGPAE